MAADPVGGGPRPARLTSGLDLASEEGRPPSTLAGANLLSKATLWWLNGLMAEGAKRSLDDGDVWELPPGDRSSEALARFNAERRCGSVGLVVALRRAFGWRWLVACAMHVCLTLTSFMTPLFVRLILEFVEEGNDEPTRNGYLYALGLGMTTQTTSLIVNNMFYHLSRMGSIIRSVLMAAIFEKSLVLSSVAKQASSTGSIVNLMANDAQRVFELTQFFNFLWVTPLVTTAVLVLLWQQVGVAALAGVALTFLTIPLQAKFASWIGAARHAMVALTDERTKIQSEVLQGVRVVKFNAWERAFAARVDELRKRELRELSIMNFCKAANLAITFVWPLIVALVMFATYTALGNELSATRVFVVLALMNVLRFPIALFPLALGAFVEGRVSLERLERFLSQDEVDRDFYDERSLDATGLAKPAVQVENASFRWDVDDEGGALALERISLNIKHGELVAVVGSVGSGKSTLLSAVLGELHRVRADGAAAGIVNLHGRLSYCAQQAWVRSATLRENVTFGLEYDEARYRAVIRAAALEADIAILPAGDDTEVGERGITLSGGQKARVALARALYRRDTSDIFLLDDPLSAVDVGTAKHLFREAVLGFLDGKTRVVVLNSHLHLLSSFARVVVMAEGRIIANGSYEEVLRDHAAFIEAVAVQHSTGEHGDEVKKNDDERSTSKKLAVKVKDEAPPLQRTDSLLVSEDRQVGAVKGQIYFAYFDAAKTMGSWTVWIIIALFLLGQTARVVADWWLSMWSDSKAGDGPLAGRSDSFWVGTYGAAVGATFIIVLVRGIAFVVVSLAASRNLHNRLFQAVLHASVPEFFDRTPVGRVLNRFSKDLDQIDVLLPEFLGQLLQYASHLIASLAFCCIVLPWFTLLLVPIVGVFYAIQRYFRLTSREIKRLDGVTRSPIFNLFQETLGGLTTIRAAGMSATYAEYHHYHNARHTRHFFYGHMVARWLALRLDAVSVLIVLSVSMLSIALRDTVSPGNLGLALYYSLQFVGLLQWCVRLSIECENNFTAVERLNFYSSSPSEADYDSPADLKPPKSWPAEGVVEFRDLTLRYRAELEPVLRGISFKTRPREKVGICGRTGAGKSSLMSALFRIVEAEGRGMIFLDDIDVGTIGLYDLRRQLSIIPQDPVLFSGSLRYNLDPFDEYEDERLWAALESVHLRDLVERLGDGLLSPVAEYGENFSQGQRQLLCIARALLRDSRVVVLDEATASVDTASDALVQETLREVFVDATVLVIAHRLDTILSSDRVLVLDKGRVAESGAVAELADNERGIFYGMLKQGGLLERARAKEIEDI